MMDKPPKPKGNFYTDDEIAELENLARREGLEEIWTNAIDDTIDERLYKIDKIHNAQKQFEREFNIKPNEARIMAEKLLNIDWDMDTSDQYEQARHALYLSNPEKYSKMLRRKKSSIVKPKRKPTKKPIKKVVKKCKCK